MPLRIGLFAPYDLSRAGGVTNQIRSQAKALNALGHHVRVFGPASGPLPDGEIALCSTVSVTISGTESGLGIDLSSARRISRIFADEPFDIVHVHEPLTPVAPWFAVRYARAPVVGTFHVHRERGHAFYPWGRPFLIPLMRRLACRIAVSDAARRTVARYFPGAYEIVPNGIDGDSFRVPRSKPASMDPDRLHVLYVGRLEPRKGVDHLIRAMASVQQQAPRARLLVVGEGPERGSLEQLAGRLGVDVTFTGRVSDDELPAYFQWSDIVSSPAIGGESFGIVLLEAMTCGKPIVASRIEGYVELAGDTGGAVLVEPGAADALAAALLPLVQNDSLRRDIGERGRAAAHQFDWSQLAHRLTSIYETLATGSAATPATTASSAPRA